MTKVELITNIANRTGLAKASCEQVIDIFADEITHCLSSGEKVSVKGFISFEVSERKKRMGRNPKTGKVIEFSPVKTIRCNVSKAIKDAVNGK